MKVEKLNINPKDAELFEGGNFYASAYRIVGGKLEDSRFADKIRKTDLSNLILQIRRIDKEIKNLEGKNYEPIFERLLPNARRVD